MAVKQKNFRFSEETCEILSKLKDRYTKEDEKLCFTERKWTETDVLVYLIRKAYDEEW